MVTMKWPASRSPRIPVRDSPPSLSELWRAAFALRFAEGEGWGLRSDSHRRIRVYETRPVAAEAQRQNGVHGRTCTCVLLLPRWWPRANARLLLTLHPEKLALAEGLPPSSPVSEAPRSGD